MPGRRELGLLRHYLGRAGVGGETRLQFQRLNLGGVFQVLDHGRQDQLLDAAAKVDGQHLHSPVQLDAGVPGDTLVRVLLGAGRREQRQQVGVRPIGTRARSVA